MAVAPTPPFVIDGNDGTWDGLGVHTLREIADALGRPLRFEVIPDTASAAAVASGRADLAIVPATSAAERTLDFSLPFYTASLGVATRTSGSLLEVVKRVFSMRFFWIAASLAVLLFIVGAGVWAFERRSNDEEFRSSVRSGLWDGFWWAGVTMSTIGYGDKAPITVGGRVLVWMLVSMGVTAALTATLVSALGLGRFGGGPPDLPADLRGQAVGAVAGSAAARYLDEQRVPCESFDEAAAGLSAVHERRLDAFVGSAPLLESARADAGLNLSVAKTRAEPQLWAFIAREGAGFLELLDRALLDRLASPDWPDHVARYLPAR